MTAIKTNGYVASMSNDPRAAARPRAVKRQRPIEESIVVDQEPKKARRYVSSHAQQPNATFKKGFTINPQEFADEIRFKAKNAEGPYNLLLREPDILRDLPKQIAKNEIHRSNRAIGPMSNSNDSNEVWELASGFGQAGGAKVRFAIGENGLVDKLEIPTNGGTVKVELHGHRPILLDDIVSRRLDLLNRVAA